ncbi:hypothetical protein J8629_15480 [Serratia fonticola]|uniref:hypothetical protein n=1 Tax=Serratia fonticola TaxID=47917 RepID=UPI001AEA59EE|nr:hypothetical protein [Serratia fonticola]MBP0998453.1 hypothetical protein [Serratia fonticola]
MSKLKKAEKKFVEAMELLQASGEEPVNYVLGYILGCMDVSKRIEYVHEFEHIRMTITLSEYGEESHPIH